MKRLRSSYYALAGLLLLVAASSGCTSVNDQLDDYQARLNRVLDEQTAPHSVTRVPRRPVQHNRLALPQADINLLELLRLDQCRIGLTVAQKNSSLGRVALPSQQLLMELELLTHGPACVAALQQDGDERLAAKLATALAQKQAARLHYWWNAWPGSDEWQQFSGSHAPLDWDVQEPAALESTLLALDFALAQAGQLQRNELAAALQGSTMSEAHLQQLGQGKLLGRWLSSAYALIPALHQSAAVLEQRLQRSGLCPAGKPTASATILQNVFVKYYAGEVQPYLAVTDRVGRELLPRLEQMALLMPEAPAGFSDCLAELQRLRSELAQANQRHVKAWQAQLRQCGMMPGQ